MPSMFEELGTACLAPTPEAPLGYLKCRRCGGSGFYSHHVRRAHFGIPGLCLQCDGSGRIRIATPEEIAAKKKAEADQRYVASAMEAVKKIIMPDNDIRAFALIALDTLKNREPQRFAKMIDAVHAGRVNDVVVHLVKYYHQTKRG